LPFSGTVRAADNAPLAFQAGGRLQSLEIDVGQKVKAGDLLAVLDNPELGPAANAAKARVHELKTRVDQALRDVKRTRSLRRSGVAGMAELERSEENFAVLNASLATANAEAERANQLLKETKLYAPFDGDISRVFVEPGQTVSAGKTVLALDGAKGLEIEIGVPARQMKLLEIGRELSITQFGLPLESKARIIHIATTRVRNQLHRVIAALPDSSGLQAGATITLLLPSFASAPLLEIPVRSVVDTGRGVPRVFVISNGAVQSVQIQLHQVLGGTVLISGPLDVGDLVVAEGLAGLQDGNKVSVLP
jgi:RND family efflux transporter MFP subunit